jgi:hypothetical protein
VLFSVVGAFFYLRIVKLMYFDEPTDQRALGGSTLMRTVLSCNALLVLGLGVLPAALLALCKQPFPDELRRALALLRSSVQCSALPVRGGAVWQLVGLITRRS